MVYDFYKSYTIDGGKIFVFDVHCSLCFPLLLICCLPSRKRSNFRWLLIENELEFSSSEADDDDASEEQYHSFCYSLRLLFVVRF